MLPNPELGSVAFQRDQQAELATSQDLQEFWHSIKAGLRVSWLVSWSLQLLCLMLVERSPGMPPAMQPSAVTLPALIGLLFSMQSSWQLCA